jgi:hypothetical protein
MLRPTIILLETAATCVALLSPIALFHWLIKVTRIPGLDFIVNPLSALFDPFNKTLEALFHLPTMTYQGQAFPITQGIVGILLTVCFFGLSYLAAVMKQTEEKMKVALEAQYQSNLARQRLAAQKKEQIHLVKDMKVFLYISFPFAAHAELARPFERFVGFQGVSIESTPTSLFVEFQKPENALAFVQTCISQMSDSYSKLLPMEPQPPYRMSMHAVELKRDAQQEGHGLCFQLTRFAGANMVLFSHALRKVLDAHQISDNVNFQSMGDYEMLGIQQEVFRFISTNGRF